MRTLFFLIFFLATHTLYADLPTALARFEAGYEFAFKANKEVNLKKQEELIQFAKKLCQEAANHFMELRKKGATLPIAFLTYMKAENLASITGDIMWDETKLKSIQEARDRALSPSEAKDYNQVTPIPQIPTILITESQEVLKTSKLAIAAKCAITLQTKTIKLQELYLHYQKSESKNLRALYHLHCLVKKEDLPSMLKINSLDQNFRLLLQEINNGKTCLDEFVMKKDNPSSFAAHMDQDYCETKMRENSIHPHDLILLFFKSKKIPDIASTNTEFCANWLKQRTSLYHESAMTAFQHGATEVNKPFEIGEYKIPTYSIFDVLSYRFQADINIVSYFAFLGYEIFKSDLCKARFSDLAYPPACYLPTDNRAYPDRLTPTECYLASSRYPFRENLVSMKLLKKAADGGNDHAIIELAKNYLVLTKSPEEIKKGVSILRNLLKFKEKKFDKGFQLAAKGLIAQTYLTHEIGDSSECYTYAKYCYDEREKTKVSFAPPSGLYAYCLANGIGCKKNMKLAKEVLATENTPSLWGKLININTEFKEKFEKNSLELCQHMVSYCDLTREEETKCSIFYPTRYFILEKFHTLFKEKFIKGNIHDVHLKAFAMFAQVLAKTTDETAPYLSAKCQTDIADMFYFIPNLYEKAKEYINLYNETIDKPKTFLDQALQTDLPQAHLLKARCIVTRKNDYELSDRRASLTEALKLYQQYRKRMSIEDKISEKCAQEELHILNNEDDEDNCDIDLTCIENSEDDDTEENETRATESSSTSACSSTDLKKTTPEENEWYQFVEAERKLSKEKRRKERENLSLEHKIKLPKNYNPQEKTKDIKIFKLSNPTYEFVNVIFGQGETQRIHNYDVTSTEAFFVEIGCVKVDGTWIYEEDDGLVHKLCFHGGHNSGKESHKLHHGVKGIIKGFFEKIKLKPETMKLY